MAALELSGGDKLQAKLEEILSKVEKKASLRVGFLEGSTYPDGTSTPMVAAIHEFGAPAVGIPARPFIRPMIASKSPRWGNALGKLLVATDYNAAQALNTMGIGIADQMRDSIRDVTSPPLAQATILKRARKVTRKRAVDPTIAKPLIDTGNMLNSIDHQVVDEDGTT